MYNIYVYEYIYKCIYVYVFLFFIYSLISINKSYILYIKEENFNAIMHFLYFLHINFMLKNLKFLLACLTSFLSKSIIPHTYFTWSFLAYLYTLPLFHFQFAPK